MHQVLRDPSPTGRLRKKIRSPDRTIASVVSSGVTCTSSQSAPSFSCAAASTAFTVKARDVHEAGVHSGARADTFILFDDVTPDEHRHELPATGPNRGARNI